MARTIRYDNINTIPALTWNWLRLNRATLTADVAAFGGTSTVSGLQDGTDAFTCKAVATTDDLLPEHVRAMPGGLGSEASEFIDTFGTQMTVTLTAKKGAHIEQPVTSRFFPGRGKTFTDRQLIVAEPDAKLTVIMVYATGGGHADADGLLAVQTQIWAQARADVHLIKVNLLGARCTHLDDTAVFCEEGARMTLTQIELGGAKTYAGVGVTLAGDQSSFKSDTAYHCHAAQLLDMNYVVRHQGAKTDTQMTVKGVIGDEAAKVYRGTIDFQRGCAGATGDEQEETLLLSPAAVNKSIPIILCGEEDVSGTHGASIGRLGADELFYMQSRGISEQAAKQMMSRAKIAGVARRIPDPSVIAEIDAFLDTIAAVRHD
ncbi:MAG: SufD family Fe-S cluster assembly protein [Treponemataceae bacterium]|nr:SufD family Fe-S cluster assembly protein [Treponemataceae bacterium]